MLQIPIKFQVAVSKRIVSKKEGPNFGKVYNSVEGMALGIGIFKIFLPEEKVPDNLEGKTVQANFAVRVGQDFALKLEFLGFDGYSE